MQFSAPFLALLAAVQLGFSPAAASTAAAEARDNLVIYRNINFSGAAYNFENPADLGCSDVPTDFRNDFSSMIVGANIGCTLYTSFQCRGTASGRYNGNPSVGPSSFSTLGSFNRRAVSILCTRL